MSLAVCYWVLMLVWLVFGVWSALPLSPSTAKAQAPTLLLFVLLVLVGWKVFGPPIHS